MTEQKDRTLKLDLDALGSGKVVLGGVSISHLTYRVVTDSHVGRPTEVTLYLRAIDLRDVQLATDTDEVEVISGGDV